MHGNIVWTFNVCECACICINRWRNAGLRQNHNNIEQSITSPVLFTLIYKLEHELQWRAHKAHSCVRLQIDVFGTLKLRRWWCWGCSYSAATFTLCLLSYHQCTEVHRSIYFSRLIVSSHVPCFFAYFLWCLHTICVESARFYSKCCVPLYYGITFTFLRLICICIIS